MGCILQSDSIKLEMKMGEKRKKTRNINDGVYLVVDPSMEENLLLQKVEAALNSPLSVLQIWDNFSEEEKIVSLCEKITKRAHEKNVPVLINNRWKIFNQTNLDGIHFDEIPPHLPDIRASLDRPAIIGVTSNNDLDQIRRAAEAKIDYISFCSIFPSVTSNSCELVDFDVIREARQLFPGSIFLSGGIQPDNIEKLSSLEYNGVAIVSGIMSADQPDQAVHQYLEKMKIR